MSAFLEPVNKRERKRASVRPHKRAFLILRPVASAKTANNASGNALASGPNS